MDPDHEGDNGKIYACLYVNISTFSLRLIATKKKAVNGYNNNAYCIGSGEQTIEMKRGNQAFSSGNVPEVKLGEHHYAAVNDLHASTNHSAVVLKFPDSLEEKYSKDVAAPIYQTLDSGVDAPIYQPLNRGVATSIYQPLNSDLKSPDIRAEKTSERVAAPVCQPPNNGAAAPFTKHSTLDLGFQKPR